VAACVEQYVRDRVSDLAKASKDVNVAAVGEHRARAPEYPIHRPCEARSTRLETASQIPRTIGLDDHVNMVVLDRVMNETKSTTLAGLAPASLQLRD
jgi:hypothetical protein